MIYYDENADYEENVDYDENVDLIWFNMIYYDENGDYDGGWGLGWGSKIKLEKLCLVWSLYPQTVQLLQILKYKVIIDQS